MNAMEKYIRINLEAVDIAYSSVTTYLDVYVASEDKIAS